MYRDAEEDLNRIEELLVREILGENAYLQFKRGKIGHEELKPHIPAILKLSQAYNLKDKATETTLKDIRLLEAYSIYFLPINYVKIRYLFDKIELDKIVANSPKILDFGCGPGTAALAAVNYLRKKSEIFLLDSSVNAGHFAKDLIYKFSSQKATCLKEPEWKKYRYDLIIAANTINEVMSGQVEKLVEDMHVALKDKGILLILEPALKEKTKKAMEIRDLILKKYDHMKPLYPCTRKDSCPMLSSSAKDWCHGSISWSQSRLVKQVDKMTGFNKHRLKYSAFIFQKNGTLKEGYRVVSIGDKSRGAFTAKLCGKDFFGTVRLSKKTKNEKSKVLKKTNLHDLLPPDGIER